MSQQALQMPDSAALDIHQKARHYTPTVSKSGRMFGDSEEEIVQNITKKLVVSFDDPDEMARAATDLFFKKRMHTVWKGRSWVELFMGQEGFARRRDMAAEIIERASAGLKAKFKVRADELQQLRSLPVPRSRRIFEVRNEKGQLVTWRVHK